MKKIIIAVDGFSSCGKSTMAKTLAKDINYIYIDSGAMYRAVALYCIEHHLFDGDNVLEDQLRGEMNQIHVSFKLDEKTHLPVTYLNGVNVEEQIRSMEVSSKVSQVSAIDFVRTAMVQQQQELGKDRGIVMDGRDIGTTVFPNAELKIFVTADANIRARRRFDELEAKGQHTNIYDIIENVKKRDHIDQTREVSPLRKADDAITLDNSFMSIEEQQKWLYDEFTRVASK